MGCLQKAVQRNQIDETLYFIQKGACWSLSAQHYVLNRPTVSLFAYDDPEGVRVEMEMDRSRVEESFCISFELLEICLSYNIWGQAIIFGHSDIFIHNLFSHGISILHLLIPSPGDNNELYEKFYSWKMEAIYPILSSILIRNLVEIIAEYSI